MRFVCLNHHPFRGQGGASLDKFAHFLPHSPFNFPTSSSLGYFLKLPQSLICMLPRPNIAHVFKQYFEFFECFFA